MHFLAKQAYQTPEPGSSVLTGSNGEIAFRVRFGGVPPAKGQPLAHLARSESFLVGFGKPMLGVKPLKTH